MKIKLDTGEILKSDGIVTDAQGNELGYLVYCRMDRCYPITWIRPKDRVVEAIEEENHELLVFGKYDQKTASRWNSDKENE